MSDDPHGSHDWHAIVDRVIAEAEEGGRPLAGVNRAYLRSAIPVGQMSGFILVTVESRMAKKALENDLSDAIDQAIRDVTGKPMHVVVAVGDEPDDAADTVFEDADGRGPRDAAESGDRDGDRDGGRRHAYRDERDRREDHLAYRDVARGRYDAYDPYDGYGDGRPSPGRPAAHPRGREPLEEAENRRRYPTPGPGQQHAMNFDDGRPRDGRGGRDLRDARAPYERTRDARDARDPRGDRDFAADVDRDRDRHRHHGDRHHGTTHVPGRVSAGPDATIAQTADSPTLNPKYTFDTFVQGAQNQLAFSASIAVAEAPGRTYNPLFIAGGPGLGKTHLLHAIGHLISTLYPEFVVKYMSCEEFVSDFINSLQEKRMEDFRRRYRELDVLLVDDIQFLIDKEGTQEEFFHTFNALHQVNKQIVLASDRPPAELRTLEERLRTRFEWGLTADLQLPDLETRIAIVSKKAEMEGIQVPTEVLHLIAERARTSVRKLEGALLDITAHSELLGIPLTVELAERVLGADDDDVELTPGAIKSATAEYYGLTVADLEGTVKRRPIANARMIAMYLTRSLTDLSLAAIGKEFGGRDHSTVINADKKISARRGEEKDLDQELDDIAKLARERAAGR